MNRQEMVDALIDQHAKDLDQWKNTDHVLTPMSAFKGFLKMLDEAEVTEMFEEWELL
jgi:hypothetical protein